MRKATVIRSTGSWYEIQEQAGEKFSARIIGKFRLGDMILTNPVAVGDEVLFVLEKGGETNALIKEILPRKNYVVRQSPRKKHQLHLLASNIDQAMLIVTMVRPKIKQGVIDRFLLMTEPHDIPVHILFNKSDLYDEQAITEFAYYKAVYQSIGYEVFLTSSKTRENVDSIKSLLAGKVTLVAGQSGVGKSTLINTLHPSLMLKTAEISDYTGKGQHTTTFAEMYTLDDGQIIDTPGFKTLSFNNLNPLDVAHNFRELFILSEHCHFPNCTHRNEPKCEVKLKLSEGAISEMRYHNYLRILDEIEAQNYWERHTKM